MLLGLLSLVLVLAVATAIAAVTHGGVTPTPGVSSEAPAVAAVTPRADGPPATVLFPLQRP